MSKSAARLHRLYGGRNGPRYNPPLSEYYIWHLKGHFQFILQHACSSIFAVQDVKYFFKIRGVNRWYNAPDVSYLSCDIALLKYSILWKYLIPTNRQDPDPDQCQFSCPWKDLICDRIVRVHNCTLHAAQVHRTQVHTACTGPIFWAVAHCPRNKRCLVQCSCQASSSPGCNLTAIHPLPLLLWPWMCTRCSSWTCTKCSWWTCTRCSWWTCTRCSWWTCTRSFGTLLLADI